MNLARCAAWTDVDVLSYTRAPTQLHGGPPARVAAAAQRGIGGVSSGEGRAALRSRQHTAAAQDDAFHKVLRHFLVLGAVGCAQTVL